MPSAAFVKRLTFCVFLLVCKTHLKCLYFHFSVCLCAATHLTDMQRAKNKRRLPCRSCQHKRGFKHYCPSCLLWFCPNCVRPSRHLCNRMGTRDGPTLPAPPSSAEGSFESQEAGDLTMLLPGARILVRYKPVGHQCEMNNNLKQWVFERIILWRIEGILFVVTPDFELCIKHF